MTRGTYLGHQRSYLLLKIDNVVLPTPGWDPDAHAIDRDLGAMIRMTPEDATHGLGRARGLRVDLVTNGARERAPPACSRP